MTRRSLSVKDFAQPLVRKGSITREGMISGMEIGSHIHQKIQERLAASTGYQSEVTYQHQFIRDHIGLLIVGRADGVFSGTPAKIEEIKSTGAPIRLQKELEESKWSEHPYWLQLLTYCHIHFIQTEEVVECQIRLVGFRDHSEIILPIAYDPSQFEIYLEQRLNQLVSQEKLRIEWRKRRQQLAMSLKFPFTHQRKFQDQLIDDCQNVVQSHSHGLFQAPTGIGKTIGVLLPSLKDSLQRGAQTIYATPKNSQFRLVEHTICDLSKPLDQPLHSLTLTAKAKLCLNDQIICHGDHCRFAHDFYTKCSDGALVDQLKTIANLDRDSLVAFGDKYQVCPYYLSHEMLNHADVIIADYNYVFSPRHILPENLDIRSSKERPNLLVDECHNLYERSLEYYSPKLSWQRLQRMHQTTLNAASINDEWHELLAKWQEIWNRYRPQPAKSCQIYLDKKAIPDVFQIFTDFLLRYLTTAGVVPEDDHVLEFYFETMEFASVWQQEDRHSLQVYLHDGYDEKIGLVCCNAADYLNQRYEQFNAVIGFSATLKPFSFYQRLCGFAEDVTVKEFTSPFPAENRKLLVIPQISTAYRHRQGQYQKIADATIRMALLAPGHYFVFLPSYEFLQQMAQVFKTQGTTIDVHCQERGMTEAALEQLCLVLKQPSWSEVSLILCVQGGRMAEGLDIHSPYLKGAFIVGPAIPTTSFERNLRRDYYDKQFGLGFHYAYIFPAMVRSIQAAGRVIRNEDKRGLLVLMDQRFIHDDYTSSMPDFWFDQHISERVERGLLASIQAFWQGDTL